MQLLHQLANDFLGLLFPSRCFHCGAQHRGGHAFLCDTCKEELSFLTGDLCPRCGTPRSAGGCETCAKSTFVFDQARAVYSFSPVVQSLIHNLKYSDLPAVGRFLGAQAAQFIQQNEPFPWIDVIAPVPLHAVRKRHRGYNQADVIARTCARNTGIPYIANLIKRARYTQTQTKLNRTQRQQNVTGAFRVHPAHRIQGKSVVIMDDVFTTGATTNAIAEALKAGGASKVYVLTIARA
jgi:ComF family protein